VKRHLLWGVDSPLLFISLISFYVVVFMISTRMIIELARRWQKLVATRRKTSTLRTETSCTRMIIELARRWQKLVATRRKTSTLPQPFGRTDTSSCRTS